MDHVFYSWQMGAEKEANRINRYLIRDALEAAASGLQRPLTVDEATRDVPGSPDIFTTILGKIDRCAAVVADLTLLPLAESGRFTCNPNVLIEYGYALAKQRDRRLIPVVNTHFGPIEELPFDLRHKAIRVKYHLAPGASPEEFKSAGRALEGLLRSELRLIVEDPRSVLNLSDVELAVARHLLTTSGNAWPRQHVDQQELSATIGLRPLRHQTSCRRARKPWLRRAPGRRRHRHASGCADGEALLGPRPLRSGFRPARRWSPISRRACLVVREWPWPAEHAPISRKEGLGVSSPESRDRVSDSQCHR